MMYDAIILGSSFSGSLLGWILAARGMRVLVVDRGRQPRFAIGESSTPAADLILAHRSGRTPPAGALALPGIAAGVEGVRFIEAAVRSAAADGAWIGLGQETA